VRVADLVDPWLYRHPFEGRSARRYAEIERAGFGDLDARLVESWKRDLAAARRLIDVGAGPATFERALAERFPRLAVHGVEPSRDFALTGGACPMVRGRGEALPFRDGAFELGLCLSSIRHVADRAATLAELRRVVTRTAWIVELDPRASRDRVHNHTRPMRSPLLRWAFGPLVVATAPRAEDIAAVAETAGWRVIEVRPDALQPVYVMRLE
jgi:ubiquinone/menaquinone biosynthesis C-methylase UbiE